MPNDTLVFESPNDKQLFTVWVDSSFTNAQDTVYYHNRHAPGKFIEAATINPCDTMSMSNIYTEKAHKTQSHFLGAKLVVSNSKTIIDYMPRIFIIFPQEPVGASWICDSTTMDLMTVISIDTAFMDLYQTIDSVKTLRFKSHDFYISKNHGILSCFDLTDSTQIRYNNVGVQNLNKGIIIPRAKEIFDFEVGDIFYREQGGGDSEEYRTTTNKIVISSKNLSADSVFYSTKIISQTRSYSPHYGGSTHYFPISENIKTLSYSIHNAEGIESAFPQTLNYIQSPDIQYSPSLYTETFVFINNQNIIEKRNGAAFSPNSYMANIVCMTDSFSYKTTDGNPIVACGKGLGYTYRNVWSYSGLQTGFERLIGYDKVNGETWGDITFTSVSEIANSNYIHIYPNPTNNFLTIETEKLNGVSTIELYNLQGQLITTKAFEASLKLDVSNQSQGVYFIVIKDDDHKVIHREKVVIQ